MTPTEMYKRAESLFNERTKRELADMVVHREADLEDAREENAKLVVKLNAEHLVRQNAERENAKLRELARDYEHCSMHADCDLCEYDGVTSTHCPLSPCFPDIDELRDLGVEVDA